MKEEELNALVNQASKEWLKEFPTPEETANQVPRRFLEIFAKLVAEKECEACAKVCIDEVWASTVQGTAVEAFNYASKECANRIRARGQE